MTKNISQKDWEALSSYLDDQLSAKSRARLEARLQSSPELRTALEELQVTRAVIRNQPKLRAPRNFTLTPEMVGKRPKAQSWVDAGFQFAAVAASVLFGLLLLADFVISASRSQPLSAMRLQGEVEEQSMPMEAEAFVINEVVETVVVTELVEAEVVTQESLSFDRAQTATSQVEILGTGMEQGVATQEFHGQMTTTTEPVPRELIPSNEIPSETPIAFEAPEVDTDTVKAVPTGPQAGQETPASPLSTVSVEEPAPLPTAVSRLLSGVNPLRIFEFLIAMVAICMWVAVWLLRRR